MTRIPVTLLDQLAAALGTHKNDLLRALNLFDDRAEQHASIDRGALPAPADNKRTPHIGLMYHWLRVNGQIAS